MTTPLSSVQRALLAQCTPTWSLLPCHLNYWNPTLKRLVAKGLVELDRVDMAYWWREKPMTIAEAAQALCDVLPKDTHALLHYHAREELLRLRRLLENK